MKRTVICILILCLLCGCRKNDDISDFSNQSSDYEYTVSDVIDSIPESVPVIEESVAGEQKEVSIIPIPQPQVETPLPSTESQDPIVSQPQEIVETVEKLDISYGMWLSYIELNTLLKNSKSFKENFEKVIDNLVEFNISDLYIHVRSHCDSLYSSAYFPLRKYVKNYNYDVFEYMLDKCHKSGIRVHAWLNPYRVTTASSDIATISSDSPAYKWLNDSDSANDKHVILKDGIYLNPAEADARRLVVNGIGEIIQKYDVDGIHFDDYFYPSTDAGIDELSYTEYCNSTEAPLTLGDWRRANVDMLIADCESVIASSGKDIVFSISPAANIKRNYNELYADIGGWMEKGYIDEIIPQLYFGFNHTNSNYNFDKLLYDWKEFCKVNTNVKLSIGLAAYKIGTASATDGTEWQENSDILARETDICINDTDIDGVVFFSYSSLFNDNSQNIAEKENLFQVMH